MPQPLSIEDAEREVHRLAISKDGLGDIFLGCGLITYSFYMITRTALGPALNLVLIAVIFSVFGLGFYFAREDSFAPSGNGHPRTGSFDGDNSSVRGRER
jgi:hypothetical protein